MPLSPAEIRLVNELGFDQSTVEFVRSHINAPFQQLNRSTRYDVNEPAPGLSIAVSDGSEAEQLMKAVCPSLESNGYRAFWSARHSLNGMKETDEVAILKTDDPYAMIRLRMTDGANYDVSTADILDRLSSWQKISTFNIVGADHDWVAIQFIKPPKKICSFAEEVYQFCPDAVEQGVGLLREKDQPQQFKDARLLCPEIAIRPKTAEESLENIKALPAAQAEEFKRLFEQLAKVSTPTDMGIRLLAQEISRTNYLFLWWD